MFTLIKIVPKKLPGPLRGRACTKNLTKGIISREDLIYLF